MNDKQAKAALAKMYGKEAAWRCDETALTGEERQRAGESVAPLREVQKSAMAAMEARKVELLKDPEYLRLVSTYREARKAAHHASSMARRRRVTIGRLSDLCGLSVFSVTGEGDNWAEAIEDAKAREGK